MKRWKVIISNQQFSCVKEEIINWRKELTHFLHIDVEEKFEELFSGKISPKGKYLFFNFEFLAQKQYEKFFNLLFKIEENNVFIYTDKISTLPKKIIFNCEYHKYEHRQNINELYESLILFRNNPLKIHELIKNRTKSDLYFLFNHIIFNSDVRTIFTEPFQLDLNTENRINFTNKICKII